MHHDHPDRPHDDEPLRGAGPAGTANEEPGIVQEESIPSDGKDVDGEKMMEELGKHKPGPELAPDKREMPSSP